MIKTKPTALAQAILLSTLFLSTSVQATAFLPQDPRAMAMGGTGVSVANSSQAHYYNPSLLHNAREDEDFNFEIDATLRVSDTDHIVESLNTFGEDNLIGAYASSLISFTNSMTTVTANMNTFRDELNATIPNPSNINDARNNLSTSLTSLSTNTAGLSAATTGLQNGIQNVAGKPITFDSNVGGSIGVPNMETVSWAIYFDAWANVSIAGEFSDTDKDFITDVTTTLDELALTVDTVNQTISGEVVDPNQINEQLTSLTQSSTAIDATSLEDGLDSTINMAGGVIQEFGISLATNFAINGYDFDVGLTPKYLMVTTSDYKLALNDDTTGDGVFDSDDTKDHSAFNADLGISKKLTENWKTGLVIKNIIPQSFDTPSGNSEINIDPSARVGASFQNDWASVAVDFDLTENESIGGLSKTRFLAIGAELDVWLLKLRAGYRANLASSGGNVPSVGLGLYLFGLNADVAIAANQFELPTTPEQASEFDDISVAARIGIQW